MFWGEVYISHWKLAASSMRTNKQVFPNWFRAVWQLFWCWFWPLLSCGSDELYQACSSLLVEQVCKTGHTFHLQGKFTQEAGSQYMQRVLVGLR